MTTRGLTCSEQQTWKADKIKPVGSAKWLLAPDTSHWHWKFKLPTWSVSLLIVNIAFQHRAVRGVKDRLFPG